MRKYISKTNGNRKAPQHCLWDSAWESKSAKTPKEDIFSRECLQCYFIAYIPCPHTLFPNILNSPLFCIFLASQFAASHMLQHVGKTAFFFSMLNLSHWNQKLDPIHSIWKADPWQTQEKDIKNQNLTQETTSNHWANQLWKEWFIFY